MESDLWPATTCTSPSVSVTYVWLPQLLASPSQPNSGWKMCYCLATPLGDLNTGSCTSLTDFRRQAKV